MPRTARKKSSTGIYHVIIRGADHQLFFEDTKDYQKYLEFLAYYAEVCPFELYAYCLMSNHVHLLINAGEKPLESIFRRINTSYAGWFNAKYNRTGFLQQGRYHSEPVESIKYLLTVIKYIHCNPQKAGLESLPGTSYVWSSYHEYLSSGKHLVQSQPILDIYGGTEQFLVHHSTPCREKCMDIDNSRKRIPDDVARDWIKEECSCETTADFQKLSILDRNKSLNSLYKKGISIRQLNRLTGIPKGVIERTLSNK